MLDIPFDIGQVTVLDQETHGQGSCAMWPGYGRLLLRLGVLEQGASAIAY